MLPLEYLPVCSAALTTSNWKPDIRQFSHIPLAANFHTLFQISTLYSKFPHFILNEFNGSLNRQTCHFTALIMEMVNYKFQSVSSMLLSKTHFYSRTSVNKTFCVSLTLWRAALTQNFLPNTYHCHQEYQLIVSAAK